MNRYENVYCYFKNNSKEEVDNAIKKLSQEEQELLKLRFSNKWDNKYIKKFYHIIYKIKVMLEDKNNFYSNGKKVTTIYQRLNKYSKEDIDYIISLLPLTDKYLLYLKYGNDLNNPDTSNWDNKYRVQIENLIRKIGKLLKAKSLDKEVIVRIGKVLTIYQILKDYSKEEVDEVLNGLNEQDKYLLYLRYGSNLNNPDISNWDSKYNYSFYKILIPKIKYRLRRNRIKNNEVIEINPKVKINLNLERMLREINSSLLTDNYLLEKFSKKDVLIYLLVQKMDGSYSMNDLVNYFNIDRKYILKIVKNILESLVTVKCLVKR